MTSVFVYAEDDDEVRVRRPLPGGLYEVHIGSRVVLYLPRTSAERAHDELGKALATPNREDEA